MGDFAKSLPMRADSQFGRASGENIPKSILFENIIEHCPAYVNRMKRQIKNTRFQLSDKYTFIKALLG